jgi:hypothetical protein
MSRTNASVLVIAFAATVSAAAASAQARRAAPAQPARAGSVPVAIALNAAGTQYAFAGQGTCEATEQASIYGKPAALRTVRQQDGDHSVSLTFWHPRDGADMFSLVVSVSGKTHQVSTVKVGQQGEAKGSGSAVFKNEGQGGLFRIDATASDGAKITGTIKCGGFSSPMPVAG